VDTWTTKPYKRIHSKGTPIKKFPDEWEWEAVCVDSSGKKAAHRSLREILTDSIYECSFCGGRGEKPPGSRCSSCSGKGRITVNPPAVICAFCKGSGEGKPRSNLTCTACSGKGVIHVQEPVERCRHCQGIGKELTNKLPCIVCRGSGVVTVKEEYVYNKSYQGFQELEPLSSSKPYPKPRPQSASKAQPRKKTYGLPSGSEKKALEVIFNLGAADGVAVGRRMLVSSSYAHYLCKSLIKAGFLTWDSGKYILTPAGRNYWRRKNRGKK